MEDRTVVVDTENDVQYKFFNEHGTWFVAGTILGTLLLADKKPPRIKADELWCVQNGREGKFQPP